VSAATGTGFPLSPYWQTGGLRPLGVGAGGRMPGAAAAATMPNPSLPLEARIAALMAAAAARPPAPAETGTGASAPSAAAVDRGGGATPQQIADFVQRVGPLLQDAGRQLGVSPRILLAQAAIETGWGRSVVGNNLFGIKAGSSWGGAKVSAATHEYENGQLIAIRDDFRAYPSFEASVQDFVALVSGSRRYQSALGAGDDAAGYARALLAGGWATDVTYVHKLEAVAGGRHATAAFAARGAPAAPADAAATTPL
jgi:flagellar protein FlgJ